MDVLTDLNDSAEADEASGATIGLSIAASVDGVGNRQIYDLNSEGVIRVRKIQAGTYKYTAPEVVNVTEKPQAASPLSAISWLNPDQSIVSLAYDVSPPSRRQNQLTRYLFLFVF